MRIEKHSQRGKTTIRLIGHFQLEHVDELQKLIEQNSAILDLTELTLVDIDIVRFLGTCETSGVRIVNCPPYIREWMNQERKA